MTIVNSPIEQAVTEAGGPQAVADHFNINRVSVDEWITANRLPPTRVIPLARLTQWKFTPHLLAPVLYPNPTDGIPETEEVLP